MAVKKNEEVAPEPTQAPAPARRGIGGLAIAGIVVGGVLAASALFGGGVLVGSQLPNGGDRFTEAQFGPGGDRPDFGGELPPMPDGPGQGPREGNGS